MLLFVLRGKGVRICNSGYSRNTVIVPVMSQVLFDTQLVSHLLGLPSPILVQPLHLQPPRFSCDLSQSDKRISVLKNCVFPTLPELLGLEVRNATEDSA